MGLNKENMLKYFRLSCLQIQVSGQPSTILEFFWNTYSFLIPTAWKLCLVRTLSREQVVVFFLSFGVCWYSSEDCLSPETVFSLVCHSRALRSPGCRVSQSPSLAQAPEKTLAASIKQKHLCMWLMEKIQRKPGSFLINSCLVLVWYDYAFV